MLRIYEKMRVSMDFVPIGFLWISFRKHEVRRFLIVLLCRASIIEGGNNYLVTVFVIGAS